MKKHIITLIAIIAIFSACKKDAVNSGKNGKNTVPVSFNIGFSQSTGAFDVARSSGKLSARTLASVDPTLAANATTLYIAVYQSDGTRLYLTKQLSTDTVFGKAQYNLPAGTYTVAFAAGQDGLSYGGSGLTDDEMLYSKPISGGYDNTWQDTFFKKISITVTNNGINQSVTLERIDSEIVLDVEDAIPSNVKYLRMTATDNAGTYIASSFNVSSAAPNYDVGTTTTSTTAITSGAKNTKFGLIVLNYSHPYKLQITATDQLPLNGTPRGQTIAYAEVDSVAVQTGHQTIVAGQLFGGNGMTNTGGFQVTLDPVWDPTTTTIPFQ